MAFHLQSTILSFFFIIIIILIHSSSLSSSSSSPPSIYDALSSNGLPIGLLPKGITNFTIDPSTQRFQVHLNSSCNTKFETSVRFDWNFAGTLSYGRISNLSGIAAQDLFLWFPVKGIHVDVPTSGIIYFDVGVVYKQFALSSFEIPRDCTKVDDDDDDGNVGLDTELIVLTDHSREIEDKNEKLLMQHGEGDEHRATA